MILGTTYSLTFDVKMAFLSDGSHVNASSASPSSTSSSSKADTLVTMDEKQLSTVIKSGLNFYHTKFLGLVFGVGKKKLDETWDLKIPMKFLTISSK